MQQKMHLFFNSDYFRNMKPVEGAVETIGQLSQKNGLFIVTSRYKIIKEKTYEQVDGHFKGIRGICFTKNNYTNNGWNMTKAEACSMLEADVLIEDSLEYARDCAAHGFRVLLFDEPWNRAKRLPKKITRVKSWQEILQVL
jgi:uncharacterized HAD superfamily protein